VERLATPSKYEQKPADGKGDGESGRVDLSLAFRLRPMESLSIENVQIVKFVHPSVTFVPHATAKEVELLAYGSEGVARARTGSSACGLGKRPRHGVCVQHVQVVQHLVPALLVVVVATENVHILANRGGGMVGAGRGCDALLGALRNVGPGARVRVESRKVEVGAVSVEPSEDVDLGAHQARGVTREVGNLVALDGGLAEGLSFAVKVDNFVKTFGIGLLASDEDDVLPYYGCRVLESFGWHCARGLPLVAPFKASRLGDQSLLGEVPLVVKGAGCLVDSRTGDHPSIALAKLPPEHVLSRESPQVTRGTCKGAHVLCRQEGDDVERHLLWEREEQMEVG